MNDTNTKYMISGDEIRRFPERTLAQAFPKAIALSRKPGDLVQHRSRTGLRGIVAGNTISMLVNNYYGYGEFVVITTEGMSDSYQTAGDLAAHWQKVQNRA